MRLQSGVRLGPYEILSPLGVGGMGEVYRARDTRLDRDVAIKILPDLWLADPERRARFDREARVLASLNHPHIGAIYGLEERDGIGALVLELVEGPTLAERITTGPLEVSEAMAIAAQIADALDAAHERGIIHRDLKPANVKLTLDGRVKVLDFGLAKGLPGEESGPDLTRSPTVTIGGTRDGTILGTAAYMSPEQARGKGVDRRTDIWALACVVYEMLTGRATFPGDTVTDTLAAILEREPDWAALPERTPAGIRRILRRSLEKDGRRRLRDARDIRLALEDARDDSTPVIPPGRAHTRRRITLLISSTALIAGAIAGWLLGRAQLGADRRLVVPDASEMRLEITTPPTTDPVSLAISPDGRKLAFVASSAGRSLLWIRSLDSAPARPLSGTDGASFPFWSPDSTAVGFFADRQLKRIDVAVGAIQNLAPADGGRGGTWNQEGVIVFQPAPGSVPLARVASTGGQPVTLGSQLGRFPQFLPDGRHFVYYGFYGGSVTPTRSLYVSDLEGTGARRLVDSDAAGVYTSGHLLFIRGTTLLAQRFDPWTQTVSGSAFPIAGGMAINEPLGLAPLSASTIGPIVFRTGTAGGLRQFEWVDRTGRQVATVGDPVTNALSPSLSPDESRVAFHRIVAGNSDIWLLETARGLFSRLTSDPTNEFFPIWSPDGSRVVFTSNGDLYEKPSVGGGAQKLLLHASSGPAASDWSLDGRYLLYFTTEPAGGDLWVLPLQGDRKPIAVADTRFLERDGQFSPDGRWIAYTSDESGEPQVYMQPFPGPGSKVQVSTGGGGMARWRRDGRELFYIALDGRLMAVTIREDREALNALAPVPLFLTRVGGPLQANSKQQYMVARDGQRFLMNTIAEELAPPINVVVNWKAGIGK